jgi:hypothetical protein
MAYVKPFCFGFKTSVYSASQSLRGIYKDAIKLNQQRCDIAIQKDRLMICKKTMNKYEEGYGRCIEKIVQAPEMVFLVSSMN